MDRHAGFKRRSDTRLAWRVERIGDQLNRPDRSDGDSGQVPVLLEKAEGAGVTADCFEHITTAQISSFISGQMFKRGLAPKTANRFRDTCSALFGWAMSQRDVGIPQRTDVAKERSERLPLPLSSL